jgi:hypothetical protein
MKGRKGRREGEGKGRRVGGRGRGRKDSFYLLQKHILDWRSESRHIRSNIRVTVY